MRSVVLFPFDAMALNFHSNVNRFSYLGHPYSQSITIDGRQSCVEPNGTKVEDILGGNRTKRCPSLAFDVSPSLDFFQVGS